MIIKTIINNTGIITLNRPEKRNALNPELIASLKDALDEFLNNSNIRSVILTGEGKAFCAGADLEYLLKLTENSTDDNRKDSRSMAELFLNLYQYPKLLIAAVNGPAIAGGCGLASVCDFIIADEQNAKFGYSEVKIGFIPAIVSIFLIRRIGESRARQLLLSGDIIESAKALEIGLIDFVSSDPLASAIELSGRLLQNSDFSLKFIKKMIQDISVMNTRAAVEYCIELNTIGRSSEDFIKGIRSFIKK